MENPDIDVARISYVVVWSDVYSLGGISGRDSW